MSYSKEVKNILKALQCYIKKHNNNVLINVSVIGFKGEKCEVVDDMITMFGVKDSLIIDNKEKLKILKKSDEDFIYFGG